MVICRKGAPGSITTSLDKSKEVRQANVLLSRLVEATDGECVRRNCRGISTAESDMLDLKLVEDQLINILLAARDTVRESSLSLYMRRLTDRTDILPAHFLRLCSGLASQDI